MSAALRLGTRGSPLALAQADLAAAALRAAGVESEVVVISTRGDEAPAAPLAELGPGAFASALEEALLAGRVDVAVHSAKDLTGEQPAGLALAAFLPRADPRDAWCGAAASLDAVPAGARVGTSSLRRCALLARLRPDLELVPVRGNVQTRLDRRTADGLDAVVLAACGLERVGLDREIGFRFAVDELVPEAGQGAIALQTRTGEEGGAAPADHAETRGAVLAERGVTRRLGGGCRVPVAAHAHAVEGGWRLAGWVAAPDGAAEARAEATGPDPASLVDDVVAGLRAAGAERLLAEAGA
ncbi:MAG: hydroxymethylbilane synthase [Actinomycetota bacterium]